MRKVVIKILVVLLIVFAFSRITAIQEQQKVENVNGYESYTSEKEYFFKDGEQIKK